MRSQLRHALTVGVMISREKKAHKICASFARTIMCQVVVYSFGPPSIIRKKITLDEGGFFLCRASPAYFLYVYSLRKIIVKTTLLVLFLLCTLKLLLCCVCVFFLFILDIKFVGRTSRGHTGGRSHMISHPASFCGACLTFSREKDSAIPFPRQPSSRILSTNDLIVVHSLRIFFFFF